MKQIKSNNKLIMKCSCNRCNSPAKTFFAIGFSAQSSKNSKIVTREAFTLDDKRLLAISMSDAGAFPVCNEHKKIIKAYFKAINREIR